MKTKNKYVRRSKISEAKFREMVRLFAADLDASQIAEISRLNRNTVNRYLRALRERIAQACAGVRVFQDTPKPLGGILFGGMRYTPIHTPIWG